MTHAAISNDSDTRSLPAWAQRGSTRQGRIWFTVALGVYALCAFALYWHVWTTHPSSVTVGGGDSYLESWFIGYAAHGLANGNLSFFSTLVNHPFGINMLDNTSMLALGVIGSPLTLAFGAIFTFNFFITFGLIGSALSAYLLIRRFSDFYPAAILGGLVFGFGQYMVTESGDGHLHLSFGVLFPLFFLCLHDALVRRPDRWVRNGILLASIVVCQYFISQEMMFVTVVVAIGVLAATGVVARRRIRTALPSLIRTTGVAIAGALIVLAYPIWFSMHGRAHIVGPIMPVSQAYRADLAGVVIPNSVLRITTGGHLLSIAQNFANGSGENGSYLGLPLLVLLLAGAIALRRKPVVVIAALGGAWAFLFSLGGALSVYKAPLIGNANQAVGRIPLPERIFDHVSALHNVVPARFSIFVDLAAAVVLGIVLERLALWFAHRIRSSRAGLLGAGAALAVGVVACVPLIPSLPLASATFVGAPTYFTTSLVDQIPNGSIAMVFPYPSADAPQAEAWAALAGERFSMPGGYFLVPEKNGLIDAGGVAPYARTTPLAAWATEVQAGKFAPHSRALLEKLHTTVARCGISSVVAVPQDSSTPAKTLAELEWLFGSPSASQGGAVEWYHVTHR